MIASPPRPLSARFVNRAGTAPVAPPPGVRFVVERYVKHAIGGCKLAVITAYGPPAALFELVRLLRCGVGIVADGIPCWWGMVETVRVRVNNVEVAATLEGMANRVKVTYTDDDSQSSPAGSQAETDWAEDVDSISTYGTKELITSVSEASAISAARLRDVTLAQLRYPLTDVTVTAGEPSIYATIEAVGWWKTLDWRYYENPNGFVSYEEFKGDAHVKIGQADVSGTTIWFTDQSSGDTIVDDANGFGGFIDNDVIVVSGSSEPDNNGTKHIVQAVSEHEFIVAEDVDTIGAGTDTITIHPYGERVAQSFTLPVALRIHRVRIRVRKVGEPADNLRVAIHSDFAGVPSGSQIESSSRPASDFTDEFDWYTFEFSSTNELTAGTQYWIVVSRTGANDSVNCYAVEVNEEAGFAGGTCHVFDSGGWEPRSTGAAAADVPFVFVGSIETSEQIVTIIGDAGELLGEVTVWDASGTYSSPYRDGSQTARQEVEDLLQSGTASDVRLLAEVTPGRNVRLHEEPLAGENDYLLTSTGELLTPTGRPAEIHTCPVGVWARLQDVIPGGVNLTRLADPSRLFIEESEYDATSHALTLYPRGLQSPWDFMEPGNE